MEVLNKISEIKKDLDDFNSLLDKATRQKSKDVLAIEIRKLQTELINLEKPNLPEMPKLNIKFKPQGGYDIKLTNYAWDQNKDVTKIYVTIKGVQTLPKEAVKCEFTERSMNLWIHGLENKNFHLPITNLSELINPEESHHRVKTDMVVVFLVKKVKKDWTCITSIEKTMKEAKDFSKTNFDKNEDPSASLMNMMKKMYEDGDDEMKRTIAKAWTEGQEKRATLPGMPEMPGDL